MRAVKGNKEYTIDESQMKHYQDAGFDIYGDNNNITAYGRGKTISYEDYMKAVKEVERLQELCVERHSEIEGLKAENESLKTRREPTKAVEEKKEKTAKKEGE